MKKSFWNKLLDLLFPDADRCPVCGKEGGFCEKCRGELSSLRMVSEISAFHYEGIVREMILRLKFENAAYLSEVMADFMEEALDIRGSVITSVPLHPRRRRMRGYDQSELIAKRLSLIAGIPYRPLLKKIRNTPPQSSLKTRKERTENIRGAFAVKDAEKSLAGEDVLLVDDVYTTGATAEECVSLLKEAGAQSVRIVTFAKGGAIWQQQEPCSQER